MKVLRLTNSDDLASTVPVEQRAYRITEREFEARTGERMESIQKPIWPAPELPDIIDGWIKRYEPDAVLFRVNGFWYLYRSVPLRLERALGPLGRPIGRLGVKIGETSWLRERAIYHVLQRLLLNTIGGSFYFEPDQVLDLAETCSRRIVRHESVGLVLRGQLTRWGGSPPSRQTGEVRRRETYVHHQLQALAESLRVPYVGLSPDEPAFDHLTTEADLLHTNVEGQELYARYELEALLQLWESMRRQSAVGPSA